MNVDEIVSWSTRITVVIGALTLLVRYVFMPLIQLLTTLKQSSETIKNALPLWEKFLQQWPDLSGPQSFFTDFETTKKKTLATEAFLEAEMSLKVGPVYVCSITGDCTFANKAICELWGLSHEKMMGRGWLAAIASSDRTRVWQKWQESIADQIPYELTYRIKNSRTKKWFCVTTTAIPVIDKEGNIVGYYGTFPEVEEIERVEIKKSQAILGIVKRHDKLEISLDCGHVYLTEDTDSARKWLTLNRNMNCEKCSTVFSEAS